MLLQGSTDPVKQISPLQPPLPEDSILYFKGRVMDTITGNPVAFTHVINLGRGAATICDTMGYFYIRVRRRDTLLFSALGYGPEKLPLGDSLLQLERIPDIPMRSITYSIKGVMINPLGSYETFKRRVAAMELPPSEYQINPNVLMEIERGTDTLDMIQAPVMSPVTALYNWLSKEGKEKRKYRELLEQEQFERDIAYKYSPLIVSGITGYSGFELYRFMDFCSFKKKFILESDRYEIHDAVVDRQKLYESMKEADQLNH
jgi:hypothetical protein